VTWARFTPNSRANLRTDGEACGRLRKGTSDSANAAVGDVRVGDAGATGAAFGAGAAAAGALAGACAAGAAGTDAAAGAGAGAAGADAPDVCTTRIAAPWETLSPTFTFSDFTTPPTDAGISMEALSDSTVIRLCSA